MSLAAVQRERPDVDRGAVITKACVRSADGLGLTAAQLAAVIGVSEATISRMKRGDYVLAEGAKPYELAIMLVRLYRSLDAVVDGDANVMRAWMTNRNGVLDGRPIDEVTSIAGLMNVIAYLDARRAVI